MKHAMAAGATHACQTDQQRDEGWFQWGPSARGGWQGVVLVSDGHTVHMPTWEEEMVAYVRQYVADLLHRTALTFNQEDRSTS